MIDLSQQRQQAHNDLSSNIQPRNMNAINMLRKVQSYDGLRLNISRRKLSPEADQESSCSQSEKKRIGNIMASSFSKIARR